MDSAVFELTAGGAVELLVLKGFNGLVELA